MDKLKEIWGVIKDILKNASERVSDPIIGPFLLIFLLFNYDAFLLLLVSEDFFPGFNSNEKQAYLSRILKFQSMFNSDYRRFAFPLIGLGVYKLTLILHIPETREKLY